MRYFPNSTAKYHQHDLTSLGGELTVCKALEPPESPCRKALVSPLTFGQHLYHFLNKLFPMADVKNVVEIGGGMGYLMRGLLILDPGILAKMIDIPPFLLKRQKETLKSFQADYELNNIFTINPQTLSFFDLTVLNKNIGDFPALVVDQGKKGSDSPSEYFREKLEHFCRTYDLQADKGKNVNIGAMEVIEKLYLTGIKYTYLSEHSCETAVPDEIKLYLRFESAGVPEEITLKGHQEFTIIFSYLRKIARRLNYQTIRGSFADFLTLRMNDKIKMALSLTTPINDEQEIIRQFVHDVYKYKYLILIRGRH